RPSFPTAKYFASGWAKYSPLTELAGSMAKFSVNVMPAFFSACSKSNRIRFSVWSRQAGGLGRDEIGQGLIELALRLWRLLAERMQRRQDLRPRFVPVQLDVVLDAVGRKEAVDSARRQQLAADDRVEQRVGVVEQLLGLRADSRVLKD